MSTQYYKRSIDAGNGIQFVEITNGVITQQWTKARQGYYTGDGNPELLGKSKNGMRGYGFKKVSPSQHDVLLADLSNSVDE